MLVLPMGLREVVDLLRMVDRRCLLLRYEVMDLGRSRWWVRL
jgi:hypothetical protein